MSKRWAWPSCFLVAYAACLILLLPRLPFSVDEILDLITLRGHGWREFMTRVAYNAGGTPLSYLARLPLVHWFGESAAAARLPSALFSVAACYGVFLLARRVGLRWPLLATLVFATFPLQFRYALEARAYSQALCLSVWATILFLQWINRRSFPWALLYGFSIVAGLYTQPYTLFVPVAHFLWLGIRRSGRMLAATGAVILAACLAFLPWYRFSVPLWSAGVAAMYPQSTIGWHAAGLILREIAGSGYFGTALLICGLAVAFRYGSPRDNNRGFGALYLAIPLIGAVAADWLFVYFLAIRQMIFVLVPLAIFFAAGAEALFTRSRCLAIALTIALLAASTYEDTHMFFRPHDDFSAAAQTIAADPACVIYVPEESRPYYSFFRPELASRTCDLKTAQRVAVAVSPWGREKTEAVDHSLQASGFAKRTERNVSGSVLQLYGR